MHDRSFAFVLLTMAASLSSRWLLVPLLVLGTLATVLAWWESNETSTDALKTETSASSEFSCSFAFLCASHAERKSTPMLL